MKFTFRHNSAFTKWILIGEFLLVAYLLYALTVNVYKGYRIDSYIRHFREENAKITEENRKKIEDYQYFTSDAYIEKIAKRNLGLVNPGEEVIVLPPSEDAGTIGNNGEANEEQKLKKFYHLSNPRKWWKFFFEVRE